MTGKNNGLSYGETRFPSVLRHAGNVFPVLFKSPQHPSVVLSAYLQKKHRLPAEEKRAVSSFAFNALRLYPLAVYAAAAASRSISWDIGVSVLDKRGWFSVKFLPSEAGYAIVAAAAVIAHDAYPGALDPGDIPGDIAHAVAAFLKEHTPCPYADAWIRAVTEAHSGIADEAVKIVTHGNPDENAISTLAISACVQPWILESWAHAHPGGWAHALNLGRSLLYPSPVVLRVNGGSGMRIIVLDELKKIGIPARIGNLSPAALILQERARVTETGLYRDGKFEIQDEGSQLIGYAVAPQPGGRAFDACAGAGGKTLHLASLMENQGTVLAADTEFHRLKQVLPRASRAGFTCIEALPSGAVEKAIEDYAQSFASVLIDAPCTSLGTARRYPLPKWRLEEKSMKKIVRVQSDLLERYAPMVAPGGHLVYATCSLLPQENTEAVAKFLGTHPEFAPSPLAEAFDSFGIRIEGLDSDRHTMQLTPLEHDADGFFIARLKRNL